MTKAREDLLDILKGSKVVPLSGRHLTAATCQRFNYRVRKNLKGEWEQVAVYTNPLGAPVYLKIRNTGLDGHAKAFYAVGDNVDALLFGQHLCGSGRKFLIVTEGEIDCMSVSQVFDHRYAVVSIPNGAAEAAKAVAKHLAWINSFDKVVLCFDMDPVGRKAAEASAKLLPPGKAYVAILGEKDPSEYLQKENEEALIQAINNAQPYRPDGILDARQLTERCLNPIISGLPWPWQFLTEWTYGRRDGEVYIWGGGTGIGKTDFLAEVVASTITGRAHSGEEYQPEGCAVFSYETGPAPLKKSIAGKIYRRRFHIPNEDDSAPSWTHDELVQAMAAMDTTYWNKGGKLFINDSYGAADWESVRDRIRFLVHAEGIKHAFVDPLSALVVGAEDERKDLDELILQASSLSQELSIKIYIASHLSRPEGKSHEEGGHVSLKHFRGSNGIVMFASFVLGLERDQQAENQDERTKTVVRCLKDRYTGNSVGKTKALYYDTLSGSLDVPASVDNAIG